MTNAIEAFRLADAANKKLQKNLRTCEFLAMHPGQPDPFVVHANLLARLEAAAKKATAEWTAIAKNMTTAEIVTVMTAN